VPLLLASISTQEFPHPFEVIVCDDGSSQGMQEVIREYSSTLDMRYIWQSKHGYRAARSKNNGIRCAQGQILLFLDGDILLPPGYLASHMAARTHAHQVVCNPRLWLLGTENVELSGLEAKIVSAAPMVQDLLTLYQQHPEDRSLVSQMEAMSVDIDRSMQRRYAASDTPWLACIGFSFSVDNEPGVFFDENFQGWGPEDRELALRLTLDGYSVKYQDDFHVLHLENYSTGRPRTSGLPTEHEQIVDLLHNNVYLQDRYSHTDLSDLTQIVLSYELDLDTNRWRVHTSQETDGPADTARDRLTHKLQMVKDWLSRNGRLQQCRDAEERRVNRRNQIRGSAEESEPSDLPNPGSGIRGNANRIPGDREGRSGMTTNTLPD